MNLLKELLNEGTPTAWAKDMIKIIKSVDKKIDTGVGGMASSDMAWVDKVTVDTLIQKFKASDYKIKRSGNANIIISKTNPSAGISINKPEADEKDLPDFKGKLGLMFYDESISESIEVKDLSSGMFRNPKARAKVKDVTSGKDTVTLKNKEYQSTGQAVRHTDLEKGMIVLASHDKYNQGAEVYEILGFTGTDKKYGKGGAKFNSIKDVMNDEGVKTLKELEEKQNKNEYGFHTYMVVKDLNDGDTGPFFYLFEGKMSYGSGAEPLSFWLMEEV